jgi:hypothetical protein
MNNIDHFRFVQIVDSVYAKTDKQQASDVKINIGHIQKKICHFIRLQEKHVVFIRFYSKKKTKIFKIIFFTKKIKCLNLKLHRLFGRRMDRYHRFQICYIFL